jgi:hypothetical protein
LAISFFTLAQGLFSLLTLGNVNGYPNYADDLAFQIIVWRVDGIESNPLRGANDMSQFTGQGLINSINDR